MCHTRRLFGSYKVRLDARDAIYLLRAVLSQQPLGWSFSLPVSASPNDLVGLLQACCYRKKVAHKKYLMDNNAVLFTAKNTELQVRRSRWI